MARKPTPAANNSGVIDIGLDIGYGATKAIMGDQSIIFPSVRAFARQTKYQPEELSNNHPGDQIFDDDGRDWFIGDLAVKHSLVGEQFRLRGRTANESALGNNFRITMMKAALGKLFAGVKNGDAVHVRIATGLPVDHMRDAGELKAALMGTHRVKTDVTDLVVNVAQVMVMPQPYGTIYSRMLTEQGLINKCHTANRTGVCDVGTYTVDLCLDDDGEYIDSQSGSVEGGVYMTQDRIAQAIQRDFRHTAGIRELESVLRSGCVKISGETHDYSAEVQEALEPLRNATLTLMNGRWGTGAGVDVIYVSGGGAALVFEDVKEAYKQAVLVENAQFANARGYLNYARFSAQE